MRAITVLTAGLASVLLAAAAPAPTPEEAWKAGIADQNKDYAEVPHAMLKIQDSAYLHDGNTAVLTGQSGNPGSYHWSNDPAAHGVLTVALKDGKISVAKNGVPESLEALGKSIAIDKDVDVQG